jgi:hypothetical protein
MNDQSENYPWVMRTDFSSDVAWESVCALIALPQTDEQFCAYVRYVSDLKYKGLLLEQLVQALPDDYLGFLCFIVDNVTLKDAEYPILVIDFSPTSDDMLDYQRYPRQTPIADIRTFRAIPSTIQSIQNNLSIANMDFEEFAGNVDTDGIFRGFKN